MPPPGGRTWSTDCARVIINARVRSFQPLFLHWPMQALSRDNFLYLSCLLARQGGHVYSDVHPLTRIKCSLSPPSCSCVPSRLVLPHLTFAWNCCPWTTAPQSTLLTRPPTTRYLPYLGRRSLLAATILATTPSPFSLTDSLLLDHDDDNAITVLAHKKITRNVHPVAASPTEDLRIVQRCPEDPQLTLPLSRPAPISPRNVKVFSTASSPQVPLPGGGLGQSTAHMPCRDQSL